MKKVISVNIFLITLLLFLIPFFWIPTGFVDIGGDSGRLYFFDAWAMAKNIYSMQNALGATIYAFVPQMIFFSFLQKFIVSPTYLIALEHGIQLSLSFVFIYLIVKELLARSEKLVSYVTEWSAVVSGIVYVGFITKTGWVTSLTIHNQVFLNPLIFYLLLKFLFSSQFRYVISILIVTVLFSFNFGFSAMPQLASFYPFSIAFLYLYHRLFIKEQFPWKGLILLVVCFLGLHALHIIPIGVSLMDRGGTWNTYIFSQESQRNSGLNYFDFNRQTLGKLSLELFQPANWNGKTIFLFVIPLITFLGFMKKRSRLLSLTSFFFAVTFYLVSANITMIGVKIYRLFFRLPGFMMFRSFDEKWYYVFVFFFTILFAISLSNLLVKMRKRVSVIIGGIVIFSILFRIFPFLTGKPYQSTFIYQSRNVSQVFDLDTDLIDALNYVRRLPNDGNVLTLPLTLPYIQVVYGKHSGAYAGISMVQYLANRNDYAGFWQFGPYQETLLTALRNNNTHQVTQILSLNNIRYIFRNKDSRIMDDFPKFPYYRYDITTAIPAIDSQDSYDQFLKLLPLSNKFDKGVFQISEFNESIIRPTIYIPDILYASQSGAINGSSLRSGYVDEKTCNEMFLCDIQVLDIPKLTFTRITPQSYQVHLNLGNRKSPFVIVLSDNYHSSWTLAFSDNHLAPGIKHIKVNGYANGWIVDPTKMNGEETISGKIYLDFQKYFLWGRVVSIGTLCILVLAGLYKGVKKYGFKK
jgi:hypothetical protein